MISVKHKGNFNNLEHFINVVFKRDYLNILAEYGKRGVEALRAATPVDTGLTRDSWGFEIVTNGSKTTIRWTNSNVQNGVLIAIILQYGHGTRNGGYVQGIDYINPAIQPIFKQMANEAWERVIA